MLDKKTVQESDASELLSLGGGAKVFVIPEVLLSEPLIRSLIRLIEAAWVVDQQRPTGIPEALAARHILKSLDREVWQSIDGQLRNRFVSVEGKVVDFVLLREFRAELLEKIGPLFDSIQENLLISLRAVLLWALVSGLSKDVSPQSELVRRARRLWFQLLATDDPSSIPDYRKTLTIGACPVDFVGIQSGGFTRLTELRIEANSAATLNAIRIIRCSALIDAYLEGIDLEPIEASRDKVLRVQLNSQSGCYEYARWLTADGRSLRSAFKTLRSQQERLGTTQFHATFNGFRRAFYEKQNKVMPKSHDL